MPLPPQMPPQSLGGTLCPLVQPRCLPLASAADAQRLTIVCRGDDAATAFDVAAKSNTSLANAASAAAACGGGVRDGNIGGPTSGPGNAEDVTSASKPLKGVCHGQHEGRQSERRQGRPLPRPALTFIVLDDLYRTI